jgi:hypothetical protein
LRTRSGGDDGLVSGGAGVARTTTKAIGTGATALGLGGSVATASAATIGGVVIAGLAVGALIGYGLRQAFGEARAVRAEEAQMQGVLVLRDVRRQIEAKTGKPISRAAARALFEEYEDQLVQLGFTKDPVTGMWRRERSTLERVLG